MMQTYTELDLLRFIYKEVGICEYFEMDYAIRNDKYLRQDYKSLLSVMNRLDEEAYEPSDSSLSNVLRYAAMA